MAEIHRLDVEVAEKAKTKLVTSITHELRTPLHGILGTADILSDTALNAMQYGMVHTIESCGRTLLGTINNLLDLTFIDNRLIYPLVRRRGFACRIKNAVLEEVTESIFAGYSFYSHPHAPPPALTCSSSWSAGPAGASDQVGARASQVTIIFDIQSDTEWDFDTHAGAWRRILMNVFGNALKYTPSGYIYVGLESHQSRASRSQTGPVNELLGEQNQEFEVTLIVKDTGIGIGPEYLQNDLFTPFMQEDPLACGSGLGLSIVHQAVGSLGGSTEINSTQGVGTELLIRTPLSRFPGTSDVSSNSVFKRADFYSGKGDWSAGVRVLFPLSPRYSVYSSLERLCRDWFDL
ncbi:unnamed protein product [Penicillium nalgiovense]|nr:unnamed protein product [Penicillium nalgiovense]